MIMIYLIILFISTIVCSSNAEVVQEDHLKIVQAGEDVNLTCTFSKLLQATTAWFKQTADRKNIQIVSLYLKQQPSWNEDFDKTNRFNVIKGDDHFNLTILKTKPSDSATYYCVVASYYTVEMGAGARLLVKDAAVDKHLTLQQSLIDTLHTGDSVSLQCNIFTESCAGEHSVYWFRQSLGESQGVLYTEGERNGLCENRTGSQTQRCVYNLFKSNVSHSDAGIYYCAVAACGEILFGKGTELNFRVCSSNAEVVQEDHLKIVQAGEDLNLTCTFSKLLQATTAWFKQTADRKNIQIVSLYLKQQPSWNEDFDKTNRFNVIKGDDHFNLTILKTKLSDSATYYCVVSSHYTVEMGAGARLLVKDAAVDRHLTLQQSSIDTLHPGDSVSLQCNIFTESCAGEHSVYWFRQSLGESQGVLYTEGERNGQCENRTGSQTQSCVYNLFKSNISHSDAGIYYCAVAACGEILFGKGTELNFSGNMKMKCLNEDTLNYAAISFGQKPLNSRRAKAKTSQDQSLQAPDLTHPPPSQDGSSGLFENVNKGPIHCLGHLVATASLTPLSLLLMLQYWIYVQVLRWTYKRHSLSPSNTSLSPNPHHVGS
ncbi:immunoglobulin superfamily member 3 [Carassius auratus]|uniref:immunoglobulin superfamily member 3 n=1 Tax=Carassius auratus TaxID=7957 RepID=UPI000E414A7E|nr:immunoglobulin superfamily member 3-like [Carassius auratus]